MISVRLAKLGDDDAIARLTASIQQLHSRALPDLFRPPHEELFPLEKLSALLKDSNNIVAVAEVEDEIIGHVYGEAIRRAQSEFRHAETTIYIHQIGVREDSRSLGIGTALLGFIDERATAIGASAIGLDHWIFNTSAREFFEKRGFVPSQVKMRKALSE